MQIRRISFVAQGAVAISLLRMLQCEKNSAFRKMQISVVNYVATLSIVTCGNFSVQPALIVPPYTMIAGRFKRPIAIKQPGMFLSQPGIATKASYHWRVDENKLSIAQDMVDVEDLVLPVHP